MSLRSLFIGSLIWLASMSALAGPALDSDIPPCRIDSQLAAYVQKMASLALSGVSSAITNLSLTAVVVNRPTPSAQTLQILLIQDAYRAATDRNGCIKRGVRTPFDARIPDRFTVTSGCSAVRS